MTAPPEACGPPDVAATAFVHPRASVCGRVRLDAGVSVWAGAVLRGDTDRITIGEGTNIQDLVMVHADPGVPATVGARVTVGHRAILHGCRVEDDVLIGMGAILLNGSHIGSGSIVGAGALVTEGMRVPPRSLVVGVPARVARETTVAERDRMGVSVERYRQLALAHRGGFVRYHPGT